MRVHVAELDNIIGEPIKVLDHGFIRLIDYMGDDSSIVQAARVSYGKGTKHVSQDQGLINYLMRHRHSTPFEMCEIKLHIKLPIFIARQWIRHRTANVNEYSARYSILDKEFYTPDQEVIAKQSLMNNQGRGEVLAHQESQKVLEILKADSNHAYQTYEQLIGDEENPGIARELARMVLPLNYYTQWYWKIDLHNLLHFVSLRADPHAQYEIQEYAKAILEIIKQWVPMTYNAFCEYRLHGMHLSKTEINVIRRCLAGEKVNQKNSGLTSRLWQEFTEKFGEIADA